MDYLQHVREERLIGAVPESVRGHRVPEMRHQLGEEGKKGGREGRREEGREGGRKREREEKGEGGREGGRAVDVLLGLWMSVGGALGTELRFIVIHF